jgi:hypothetical protein
LWHCIFSTRLYKHMHYRYYVNVCVCVCVYIDFFKNLLCVTSYMSLYHFKLCINVFTEFGVVWSFILTASYHWVLTWLSSVFFRSFVWPYLEK